LNAEINVVSLIDVMMLLLVIFMITAPLMQGGVDVKLPSADAKPLENKSSLVVSIDARGRIFVDRDEMTYSQFRSAFKTIVGSKASQGVSLRADARASWEQVSRVIAVMRSAGVNGLGIVTEQEPPPPQ
jgi:biopolymer transport protein ExbD